MVKEVVQYKLSNRKEEIGEETKIGEITIKYRLRIYVREKYNPQRNGKDLILG